MSTDDPTEAEPAGIPPADQATAELGADRVAADRAAADPAADEGAADPAADRAADQGAADRAASKREHAVRGTLAAALILEGITVLFVPQTIAAIGEDGLGGRRLALLLLLAVGLFVAAGMQKRPAGLLLGSILQIAVILTGLMVAAMYFLGLLFAAVWGFLLWVRQEVGRAAARQAGSPPV